MAPTLKDISASVYSKTVTFEIDGAIRRLAADGCLQTTWVKDEALAFGRHLLDVAYNEARDELAREKPGEAMADWKISGDIAAEAQGWLDRLTKHLIGKQADGVPESKALAYALAHMRHTSRYPDILSVDSRRAETEKARADAKTLVAAGQVLSWVADECARRRSRIADATQNPGKPYQLAFAKRVMEGWIFLTHSRPSENNSDFMGLLADAWTDICETQADWVHSVRWAIRQISTDEVARIARSGPSWALRPEED